MSTVYLLSFAAANLSDQIAQTKMALKASSTRMWQWSRQHGLDTAEATPTTDPFFSNLEGLPPREVLAKLSNPAGKAEFPDSWDFSTSCDSSPECFLASSGSITERRRDGSPSRAIGLIRDVSDHQRAVHADSALRQQKALLKSIQLRLNPHFLFNALNAVRSTVHHDPGKASHAIDSLARVLRANLHNADRPMISLKEEIENIRDLILIASLRFADRLSSKVDFPEELGNRPVPPMILYNLVENAIVHGVEKRAAPSFLHVRIQERRERLVMEVFNEGELPPAPRAGEGLRNIQQRLEILYGGDAIFELTMPETGTIQAYLEIPTETNAIPDR
ncbi:sensor histidine kinase [Haloferula sp. A504]|uniref:sensor histidine kinase n=1 Tax=Haloferula sp. A504 TaxID=3373601 RepID=UPI0031CA182A|nr:histidine kinase [Verrucomicrobiaceae bacterium E54]